MIGLVESKPSVSRGEASESSDLLEEVKCYGPVVATIQRAVEYLLYDVVNHVMEKVVPRETEEEVLSSQRVSKSKPLSCAPGADSGQSQPNPTARGQELQLTSMVGTT